MVRGALGKVPGSSPAKEVESLRRRVAEVEATALTHAVAEQRILKLNADLRRIFDDAPIGLCYLDTDLRFVHINKWLAQLNGLSVSSHVGKTIREVLPEVAVGVEQQMRQVIATGQPIIAGMVDAETPAQEGVRRTFEHYYQADIGADGAVAGVSCAVLDVTDRRLAEDQFRDSQKLESLGILAGGIAHDFNNLLTGILGYADVILRRISPASPVRVPAEQIRTAAHRASDLCDQMLAFSGKGRFVVRPFDLSEAVEVMGKLLAVAIHKSVVLRYELARDLQAIEADLSQVQQVIMNLITNASEAIERKSGLVTITTGMMQVNRRYLRSARFDEALAEGLYVFLEVSDTGRGMNEEVRSKMFDPFFTTKFTGRGLGLAAVRGIVRAHAGTIKVYSEVGRGTTVKVLFPATAVASESIDSDQTIAEAWRSSATVLVVDDEGLVRELLKDELEVVGCTVLTAIDGRAGVELFQAHPEIDAVLLDMTMPHMDGPAAFAELREIRPDVAVILMSGYNEQEATSRFAGKGLAGFLKKPFRMELLHKKLREVLD